MGDSLIDLFFVLNQTTSLPLSTHRRDTSFAMAAAAKNVADSISAHASEPKKLSGLALYSRFAFAGAVCCSVTHGGLTPVDVVKTRIQLDPKTYNTGMIGSFRKVIQNEGAGALLTGVGPTFAGYFLQGAFKFGGYEFFKQQSINMIGYESASNNRTAVYLASAACAEFVVYEKVAEAIYQRVDKSKTSDGMQTVINLGSGLIAGFAAAIISQPADTMLSKISKTKGLPGEGTTSRLIKIAQELGLRGSFSGIGARLFMVGTLTAGQFAIYGDIKKAIGAVGGVEISK